MIRSCNWNWNRVIFWWIWWSRSHQRWHSVYYSATSLFWHWYNFPNNSLHWKIITCRITRRPICKDSYKLWITVRSRAVLFSNNNNFLKIKKKKTGQRIQIFFIGLLKISRILSCIWYPFPTITPKHQHLTTKDLNSFGIKDIFKYENFESLSGPSHTYAEYQLQAV